MGNRILVQVTGEACHTRDRRLITNYFNRLTDSDLNSQRLLDNIDQVYSWFISSGDTGHALGFLASGCLRAVLSHRSTARRLRMQRVSHIVVSRISHWLCADDPAYNADFPFKNRLPIAYHAGNWARMYFANRADDHAVLAGGLLPILKTNIEFLTCRNAMLALDTVPIFSAVPTDVRYRQLQLFE